ncbi:MAG: SDR family oxidoreductase [Alphaproteobacteria bacterium]|jgi:NAD(P)-dependent dehydrogenase (short-subunit alcohol dehydrogenase family)|nr:short-chain dehydrogenase [Rhodospirillaceae bacterium]MDP6019728.1 SDR family oxidoreductase [Alphaproteobacteria bacterium]MDP7055500.1 SDR family oxidoreductase [Alphaproteobacteria bacterium]MDP7462623.1 SDR family oxidoreductase [Alphaproteobacteria bacterium]HJM92398.1 SDR family oxidoreductase [Alphaproteobacteria bacterium]|tara:strand:+ start:626 stop:1417 length:792 start_codon:yes stop_codon:yes gene_type:complete
MDLQLTDKIALVTGAGSGIGQHMAQGFAAAGAKVVVNDINAEGVAGTVEAIKAAGSEALAAPVDITDLAAVEGMIGSAEAAFGRVDILVNNAATLSEHTLYLETDPTACEREISVILFGTMHCSRAVLPGMIERGYGKILNIATDAARVGQEREVNYSAAKGGVISFTKSIAKEVGRHNVNVNVVSPGATNSPMRIGLQEAMKEKLGEERWLAREEKVKRLYPLRRIGEMEDVTNAVLFLTSDAARQITGQILSVNGGFAMVG